MNAIEKKEQQSSTWISHFILTVDNIFNGVQSKHTTYLHIYHKLIIIMSLPYVKHIFSQSAISGKKETHKR